METYYTLAAGLFLAIVLALLILILWALFRALAQSGREGSSLPVFVGSGLLAWLALLAYLADSGFFTDFSSVPPRIIFALLPPVLIILFLTGSGKTTALLGGLPAGWLIGAQVFRVPVEIVLWLLYLGKILPVQLTFEGLNFDVLTGLTAPLVALYLARRPEHMKTVGVVWNILGLCLLINIVTIAMLSTPSPLRVFMNEPANTIVAHFPFIWLPGFVVPVAFLLHVFSLKQLLAGTSSRQGASAEKSIVI